MRSVMASRGLIVNSSNDNCDDPVCGFRIIWLKCEISSPFLGLTLEVEGFWESVGVGRLVDEVSRRGGSDEEPGGDRKSFKGMEYTYEDR